MLRIPTTLILTNIIFLYLLYDNNLIVFIYYICITVYINNNCLFITLNNYNVSLIYSTKLIKVFIRSSKVAHFSFCSEITVRKLSRFLRKLHMSHFALTVTYSARNTYLVFYSKCLILLTRALWDKMR